MQFHELAFSYLSLHVVTRACMQLLSLSEQLTRTSQCLFFFKNMASWANFWLNQKLKEWQSLSFLLL